MTWRMLALALVQAALNGVGVALVKRSLERSGVVAGASLVRSLLEPRAILGAALIAAGFLATARLVAEARLSVAIPVMAAMSFLVTALLAAVVFRERLTWHVLLGMALIVGGTTLLTRRVYPVTSEKSLSSR